MREVADIELKRLQLACGDDPDKLAALETYISLLAALDEAKDDGDTPARLLGREVAIVAARSELMRRIRNSKHT